jgi:hypothetical protein
MTVRFVRERAQLSLGFLKLRASLVEMKIALQEQHLLSTQMHFCEEEMVDKHAIIILTRTGQTLSTLWVIVSSKIKFDLLADHKHISCSFTATDTDIQSTM